MISERSRAGKILRKIEIQQNPESQPSNLGARRGIDLVNRTKSDEH